MRNIADEPADGLHFLRFEKLVIECALIGDVPIKEDGADRALAWIDRSGGDGNVDESSVAAPALGGDTGVRALQGSFAKIARLRDFFCRRDQLVEIMPLQLITGVAKDLTKGWVHAEHGPVYVQNRDAIGGCIRKKVRIGAPQFQLRLEEWVLVLVHVWYLCKQSTKTGTHSEGLSISPVPKWNATETGRFQGSGRNWWPRMEWRRRFSF